MTTPVQPIRIAIVINGQDFLCNPVSLPFSLEGYPPVDVVLYGSNPEVVAGLPVNRLAELHPDQFDLILDAQFLTNGLDDFAPDKLDNLITGPAVPFLKGLVCQLHELRQKQEINSGIINSATDAIITINEEHVIVGFNRGAELMFGYTRAEALGQDLTLVIPPPYKAEHRAYVRRYVATREARMIGKHVRLTALRRDGHEFPMSISFSVAEIRDNLYFTGIIRDITEYKEMEERVLQSERLAAVGNTVTHIAHEIKNPLLIIGGFARQLLKTPNLDDKSNRKLSMIAEEVSHLEEMVAEMRDFVRRPSAQKQSGQIMDILREALDLFHDTFEEHHITVHQVEETPLPSLPFDPRQVRQVFLNLLKNALEAMPQGGEITITSRVQDTKAEISIADTGEGMTAEVAENIFQPYFTTKEKGTGLGLAICQSIIQEHGGTISVASTPGGGTTFIIQLPVDDAALAQE
ncbi:MAG: ATP-binding protein [Desulfobaccales bacterium]